jgi:hypothetical protein
MSSHRWPRLHKLVRLVIVLNSRRQCSGHNSSRDRPCPRQILIAEMPRNLRPLRMRQPRESSCLEFLRRSLQQLEFLRRIECHARDRPATLSRRLKHPVLHVDWRLSFPVVRVPRHVSDFLADVHPANRRMVVLAVRDENVPPAQANEISGVAIAP